MYSPHILSLDEWEMYYICVHISISKLDDYELATVLCCSQMFT